ncbi:MAG: hypothetical protein ACRC6A_01645, partial [Fusobacteriaceae bacterium]
FTFSGKLTLNEIGSGVGIATKELVKKLDLPKDISLDKPIKDIKEEYNLNIEKMRTEIENLQKK